jgi:hypothetical protein
MAPKLGVDGSLDAVTRTRVAPDSSQKMVGPTLSIGTRVTAPTGGRVVVTARGTVKITGVRKAISLTTRTRSLAAGRSTTLTLTPKGARKAGTATLAKLEAAVRAGKKVSATVTLTIADTAGNTRVAERKVQLT